MAERLRFESELGDLGVRERPLSAGRRFDGEREYAGAEDEAASWAAAIDPFPPAPSLTFDLADEPMKKAFAPVLGSSVCHLAAAVVDLTGNPAKPPYAGKKDHEMVFAGSLPKICAMYAAFALRSRVQAFVDAAKTAGASVRAPSIIAEIDKAWRPKLKALYPARPAISFGNKQDMFPALGLMFDFPASGVVDFTRGGPPLTDAQIDKVGEFGAPAGRFHEWMRSMLRWSNNLAASKCILSVGYFYLNGALTRAGLFEPTARNGIWLSADYDGHDWVRNDSDRRSNAAGQPLSPGWATAQRRSRSNITATAAKVAALLTLMAQDKLIDAASSREMRVLMNDGKSGIGSYAYSALTRVGRRPAAFRGKIGYGDDKFSHDCGIVERTVAGKDLRYVTVGMGSAPKNARKDLRDLFVLLDETIVTRNS